MGTRARVLGARLEHRTQFRRASLPSNERHRATGLVVERRVGSDQAVGILDGRRIVAQRFVNQNELDGNGRVARVQLQRTPKHLRGRGVATLALVDDAHPLEDLTVARRQVACGLQGLQSANVIAVAAVIVEPAGQMRLRQLGLQLQGRVGRPFGDSEARIGRVVLPKVHCGVRFGQLRVRQSKLGIQCQRVVEQADPKP